jgi:asparagine synthase (glutamine-hydrolysing)
MSGIVGVVQFDGSLVAAGLLRKLTDLLTFRGPDRQHIWIKDNVGFGHTLFKTTDESALDCQPLTLDENAWIVADARVDAREALMAELKAGGETGLLQSSCADAELILRAYRCWGTACVEHLLGDFAFGIWDDARQQLFCARDHMGVKPFYYARIGSCVIFSNTLDCIRRHPDVSDRLNDLAIADFLLFGVNQDQATTSFAEIQRLPPAHRLICSSNGLQSSRYWSMPIDEPLFYRRPDEYIDQFHDLLRRSVADRLRTRQVWIFMSGGIDSPTLAAASRDLMRERDADFDLRAFTKIDSFVPDEGSYAAATAKYLGIPIVYRCWTEDLDLRWEQIPFSTPEPVHHAWMIPAENNFWREMGTYSRVFFYGEGPDNALRCDWKPYLAYSFGKRNYRRLLGSLIRTVLAEKRPPFWGRIARRFGRAAHSENDSGTAYPEWLNPSFEARLNLRARWSSVNTPPPSAHPYRPVGYMSLQIPLWQAMFERLDPAVTKSFFEVRHPFVDIRMLRFLLSVPSLPWCRSKYLLRRAMRGNLPTEVLLRRKAAVGGRRLEAFWAGFCSYPFLPAAQIHEYVDSQRLGGLPPAADIEGSFRVRSFNHWLQNYHQSSHNRWEGGVRE